MSDENEKSKDKNPGDIKDVSTFSGYDVNMINEPDLPVVFEDN